MVISAKSITFSRFWLNNVFCIRDWAKRKAKLKKRISQSRGTKKFDLLFRLIFIYMELPMYAVPIMVNLVFEEKKQQEICRGLSISIAYIASLLICRFILFPLCGFGWLSSVLIFYTSGNYTPSDDLRGHIYDLVGKREALYNLYWVCNQNIVFKILMILFSIYLLIILVKVILDQLVRLFIKS